MRPEHREYFDAPKVVDIEHVAAELVGLREHRQVQEGCDCWTADNGFRETMFASKPRPRSASQPLQRAPQEDEWAKAIQRAERAAVAAAERVVGEEEPPPANAWDSRFGVKGHGGAPRRRSGASALVGQQRRSVQLKGPDCPTRARRCKSAATLLEATYGRPLVKSASRHCVA